MEVVRSTYIELLPSVREHISKAAFVAIDSEFTGLHLNRTTRPSLFDSPEERYIKSRTSVRNFTVAQFGLTAFISQPSNKYEAHCYNFYLYPTSIANYDCRFTMQASSVQFLIQYGFDFNKMFREGIPYMNRSQHALVTRHMKAGSVGSSFGDEMAVKDGLRQISSQIARWLVQARDGDIFTYNKQDDAIQVPNQILHTNLVHRFDCIIPLESSEEALIVKKIAPEQRKLSRTNVESSVSESIQRAFGFSHVIQHLIESKKVLVGHNVYLDLMLIYEKFIDHLPPSYAEYKRKLHECFPEIYDTKHMAVVISKLVKDETLIPGTGLSELYLALASRETAIKLLYMPFVIEPCQGGNCAAKAEDTETGDEVSTNGKENSTYLGQVHEAGFDSYMCARVFLMLAYLKCIHTNEAMKTHPLNIHEYMKQIEEYKNKVNLIRAAVHHMNTAGPDPISERPDLVYITTRGWNQTLNTNQLSQLLSSFGSCDIKELSDTQALVTVGNYAGFRRILAGFKGHELYHVQSYNPWVHSKTARRVWIVGGLGLLSAGGLLLYKYVVS